MRTQPAFYEQLTAGEKIEVAKSFPWAGPDGGSSYYQSTKDGAWICYTPRGSIKKMDWRKGMWVALNDREHFRGFLRSELQEGFNELTAVIGKPEGQFYFDVPRWMLDFACAAIELVLGVEPKVAGKFRDADDRLMMKIEGNASRVNSRGE